MDLFALTRGNPQSPIMIVGEAWGFNEFEAGQPFVGASGQELERMLSEANLPVITSFLYTNVVSAKPKANDFLEFVLPGTNPKFQGINPSQELRLGLNTLYTQIEIVKPRLVIAVGNWALWALTNKARIQRDSSNDKYYPTGISDFHGSQLWLHQQGRDALTATNLLRGMVPVLPIFHPAAIMREWTLRSQTVHDLKTRIPKALKPFSDWSPIRNMVFHHGTDLVIIDNMLEHFTQGSWVTVDVETKFNTLLTCIGIGDERESLSIPFVKINPDKSLSPFWSIQQEAQIYQTLQAYLTKPNFYINGQNLVYDMQWFHQRLGIRPKIIHDTMVAQNTIWPGTRKDLGHLSAIYCENHAYWKDDNHEWANEGTLEQHLNYNGEDIVRTAQIALKQRQVIQQLGLTDQWKIELAKIDLAMDMNIRGTRRDENARRAQARQLLEEQAQLQTILSRLVKQEWVPTKGKDPKPWYRSHSQTKWVLYELMKLPPQKSRATGNLTVGKEALNYLKERFPQFGLMFQSLLDYGSLDTIYSTFYNTAADPDGRFRTSFNPAGTETFRFSSSKTAFNRGGNMQNIPAGGE